ncbi:MAG: flagellar motor switch protein FliG [Desulfatiglans sp.]|jgi:flagellar motor switch protein FliG|nr:flagellar motor switch protein FliG [Thermodesulfobacteriota bacterium]MEE4354470.1 flagellar motor switch protein FliG [Desulfatiglans sp.]
MDPKNLPGSLKAAILIYSVGKEAAQSILERLSESERAVMESHLSQMGNIPPELIEQVAQEFTLIAGRREPLSIQGTSTLSQEEDEKDDSNGSGSMEASLKVLRSLEPEKITELIRDEHPQTIAITLAHLNPETASDVLSSLPDEVMTDVAVRIANMDRVISEMVEEIGKVVENLLEEKDTSGAHKIGGVDHVADILNQAVGPTSQQILDDISEVDPDLADRIKQRMFVFDDLVLIDDRGLQQVMRNVETQVLGMALKAATDEVKDKILNNMSQRAGEMLKEEMESMGPVRMKDVEAAQQTITRVIQEMEEKGEVVIAGRGGEKLIE